MNVTKFYETKKGAQVAATRLNRKAKGLELYVVRFEIGGYVVVDLDVTPDLISSGQY